MSSPYLPATIRVLGTDDDGQIIIWDTEYRRVYYAKNIDSITEAQLVHYAGDAAFSEAETIIHLADKEASVMRVMRRTIADEARQVLFLVKDTVGQGVWRIPGQTGLWIVSGNRAFQYDNGAWIGQQLPVIGKRLFDLDHDAWVDISQLRMITDSLTPETIKETWERLVGKLAAWKFKHDHDHQLIAGLIVATAIQAALEFRPQVWVVGPTDAGKTVLKNFLAGLWPYAEQCENESTEASVRQTIGHNAMPVLLDEQEQSPSRNKLIKTMRSSTRGGKITRGTTSGKPMVFHVNHISWWFSVEYNLSRAADRNRFAVFELVKQDQFQMPDWSDLPDLGMRVLACAMRCADQITAEFNVLARDAAYSKFGRLTEVFALPVAIIRVMTGLDVRDFFAKVMEVQSVVMESECPTDEQDLIQTLLTARPAGSNTPLSYYLGRERQRGDTTLEDNGIRLMGLGYVFLATEVVKKNLLAGTKWADTNVKLMLARIEGAKIDKQRINGMNLNGVTLSLEKLLPQDLSVAQAPAVAPKVLPPGPQPPQPPQLQWALQVKRPESKGYVMGGKGTGKYLKESATEEERERALRKFRADMEAEGLDPGIISDE